MVVAVVAAVTAGGYLLLLGWGRKKTLGADGYLHGPYEPGRVVALVAVLGVLAGWAGWRGRILLGTLVATAVATVLWSIDAANDTQSEGLWPVGTVLVMTCTACGSLAVSSSANHLRALRTAHHARR